MIKKAEGWEDVALLLQDLVKSAASARAALRVDEPWEADSILSGAIERFAHATGMPDGLLEEKD